jgi:hypothetical protein
MILHHMFRDQIAGAGQRLDPLQEDELRRAYRYFSRKYPVPELMPPHPPLAAR